MKKANALYIGITLAIIAVFGVMAFAIIHALPKHHDYVYSPTEIIEYDPYENYSPTDVSGIEGPVEYYGELMLDGKRIVAEETARPTQITGMSFFWSNWASKFYTAETVDRMVDEFGCEVVRASYGVDDDGVPYVKNDVELVENVIERAIDRQIYVIVDWHSHGAHNNPDKAIEFFSRIAQKYGEYDNVIFEIYNEPVHISWNEVKAYAEKIIPVIRKYSDNLIVVGSPTWSQDVDTAALNPIADRNVAYSLHFYAGTHKKSIRDKAEKAIKNGSALFVTEWGSVNADGNGRINYDSSMEWINWCDKNNISMCNWAINDKDETSSIFNPDGTLTTTGKFVKSVIKARTASSEWKTGKPYWYKEIRLDGKKNAA